MNINEQTELAVSVGDKYISIQTCEEGYEYSIYSTHFDLLDGGIIDSQEQPMREVLDNIMEELALLPINAEPVDYDVLSEKVEIASESNFASSIVASFRFKTALHFDAIVGMDVKGVEEEIRHVLEDVVRESGYLIPIQDVIVTGKRARGLGMTDEPIDVVVSHFDSRLDEMELDQLFNAPALKLDDLPIHVHPVEAQHLGTHFLCEETNLARVMREAFSYHKNHLKEETAIVVRPSIVQALKDAEIVPENKKLNQIPKREER
ncbi:hypothetical protein BMT55_08315 [Listeria newyorkensis]|uniref:Large polyvalent protein-associated domain-containing protein n=1 Tax=Listeria newyorkensis TaxID=1497681 RepID=A0ABX4XNH7_9LIST|nr:LPD16 domain-containing protein [Listeria newyorkensis]PNP92562.1 hypothetical protein BMT55_08315 [Listeria newyorkensis]